MEDVCAVFNSQVSTDIVDLAEDSENAAELFRRLARHPFKEIRASVARKNALPLDSWMLLINDPNPEVSLIAAYNQNKIVEAGSIFVADLLLERPWLLDGMSSGIKDLFDTEGSDQKGLERLINFIIDYPDLNVVSNIIRYYSAPKILVRRLTEHPNEEIASKAKQKLKED